MRDHRALGLAGGARGVDQDREVLGLARGQALLPDALVLLVVVGTQRAQRLERHHLGVVEVAQAVHVEDDDLAQLRQALAHFQDLVELLLVLHEHDHRSRIGEQVLGLRRRVGRIDAVGDAGGAENAEVGVHPLAVGVGLDRGHLARLKAQRHEPHADFARHLAQLGPGHRAPDAEVLLAQDHLRAARLHAVPEHAPDSAVLDRPHRCPFPLAYRHCFFLFQRRCPRTPAACTPR